MKAIVTGGAGFIGSNLAEELLKEHEVIVIDNLSTGRLDNIKKLMGTKNFEFIQGSVTDLNMLKEAFRDAQYIFHQAAIPSVQRSIGNPIATNEVNITGTFNVLIAARDCDVKKVVYASSSSVYGDTPDIPKREGMKPNPLSPYAVSKLTGEYYCKVFNEVYGLKTVSLRYFNVYGPRQDPFSEYAAVIPRFIKRIQKNKSPRIYGDGEETRDFTSVKDVVRANVLAASSNANGVYNIATGRSTSINELADMIMTLMARNLGVIHDEQRRGDVRHSLGDISRARSFGYEPRYSLEEGLKETIEWFNYWDLEEK